MILLVSLNDDSPVSLALVAGISIVAAIIGVDITVARPLREVRRAIYAWRVGEMFDPATDRNLPSELRAFTLSFKRAASRLVRREAELREAVTQQDLAIQEIHHRVKNNLQIVTSLLNLQATRIRVPAVQAEFTSARNRVAALGAVHRHLYVHGGVQTVNMQDFLLELCGQLFQAMDETPGDRLGLEVDAPKLDISSDQVVPLALLVTEAVANAIQYAYPFGRTGTIRISLRQMGERVELVIADDGIGIASDRDSPREGARSGIGLQLINGFARQLGADLSVEQDHGTRYRVRMALYQQRQQGPALGRGKALRP